MKTAAEINTIATAFALDRETHERALAEKYAEEVIAPIIEQEAKDGKSGTDAITKDEGINFIFLKSYLVNHGYEVKDIGKRYRIHW